MALLLKHNPAPNGPGDPAVWARGDKDGVGTAMSGSSAVWYTIAGGIITEVYYPDVDTPQLCDLQLLVTDGATFFHDGKRDFTHSCQPIEPGALGLRLTNTAIGQPYQITHDVISEAGSCCLLIRTRLQGDSAFLNKLHVYVLATPHVEGYGRGNSGYVARTPQGDQLVAHRGTTWLAIGADCGFRSTGCGFYGVNDGWRDIVGNRRLPVWNYDCAENGNVVLRGELNLSGRTEFVIAVTFSMTFGGVAADTPSSALVSLSEALSYPFEAPSNRYSHLANFLAGWKQRWTPPNANPFVPRPNTTFDQDRLFNCSRNILLAHEDKIYNGALVASLSIPWGEFVQDRGNGDAQDQRAGGYHLVWPRDMCQSATALLAAGDVDLPLRALMYLAASQGLDGTFFQNFYINGGKFGSCQQLDEFSFPILLAYRLSQAAALQHFDPRPMVLAAAGALVANGPTTRQERWEENEGYSPSTLASNIAALVCAAHFVDQNPADHATAQFLLEYADFLESHIESWTVTTRGVLHPQVLRHYIRLLPTHVKDPYRPRNPTAPEDPDSDGTTIDLANGGGTYPARAVVDAGFLELVRYGIRRPLDALIEDSLRVVDLTLKDNLPGGPCFRRYTHDGYGQQDSGGPFNGGGVGRPWPLLTGERAHYEFAAARDAGVYVRAMENFAGARKLLPEQLWNSPDLTPSPPSVSLPPLTFGGPTGAAMPLAWAHAEYIKLVRSISDGKVFDLIQIVADRYLQPHQPSPLEIWNFDRQIRAIPRGKRLRIPLTDPFRLRWSPDGWATTSDTVATATAVGIYYADISTDRTTPGPLRFTFYWVSAGRWEGVDYGVNLT
jgi:glucoamylase